MWIIEKVVFSKKKRQEDRKKLEKIRLENEQRLEKERREREERERHKHHHNHDHHCKHCTCDHDSYDDPDKC